MSTVRIGAKQTLKRWVIEAAQDADEVNYVELTQRAQEELGSDPAFAQAAVEEFIGALIPELLGEIARRRRHEVVVVSTGIVAGERIKLSAMDRISRVLEGTGSGGFKSLLAHNKEELLALNDRDETQMETTRKWVGFRGDLASKMNNSQVVGDLKPSLIEGTWNRHFSA